jgi:hypothetical protein
MGTSSWQPKWWTHDKHGSGWENVKEAIRRDWEQTKNDFKAGGRDLDQDVDDTVKQAMGEDVIPPRAQPNAPGGTTKTDGKLGWSEAEAPLRYGYGAKQQYGLEYSEWNDTIEGTLRNEWETSQDANLRGWHDVKDAVRRGYEHRDR